MTGSAIGGPYDADEGPLPEQASILQLGYGQHEWLEDADTEIGDEEFVEEQARQLATRDRVDVSDQADLRGRVATWLGIDSVADLRDAITEEYGDCFDEWDPDDHPGIVDEPVRKLEALLTDRGWRLVHAQV